MWTLRTVKIPPGRIKARRNDGRIVSIRIRQLTEAQKRLMIQALDRIKAALECCDDIEGVDDTFRNAVTAGVQHASFVTTGSKEVTSYLTPGSPIVVLNRSLFSGDFDDFCATLLYEVLHLVQGKTEVLRVSLEEAKQHLMCYALIGVDIPVGHWSFKAYPELLTEIVNLPDSEND